MNGNAGAPRWVTVWALVVLPSGCGGLTDIDSGLSDEGSGIAPVSPTESSQGTTAVFEVPSAAIADETAVVLSTPIGTATTGSITTISGGDDGTQPIEPNGTGGAGGALGAGGAPSACPSPRPPSAPLRRLSRFDYNNSVRDLFGDFSEPANALPSETYPDYTENQWLTDAQVETYHNLAHDFALSVTENAAATAAFLGCDPAEQTEDLCREELMGERLPAILRRPLSSEDAEDFQAVFSLGEDLGGDFDSGVRAVIEVALQSPEFLYRVEFGEPASDRDESWQRPTSYEMASRLSYLYWGSTPDAELLAAAAAGQLVTPEEITGQAQRLLTDERARELVRHFYSELFRLSSVELGLRNSADHPTFTDEIPPLMLEETARFIDEVTWEGPGDFRSLLTAPFTWVNEPLADFYGFDGVSGEDFGRFDTDPTRRAGLLTQGSFLAASSRGATTTRPVIRGLLVFSKLLCQLIPPPPPDVAFTEPVALTEPSTTRQRYEQHIADPTCTVCHRDIDPIGFAFEHYDAVGLWRDTENGLPIDATGVIYRTDAQGSFDGVMELSQRLAASEDAQRCYASNWFAQAYSRPPSQDDACSQELLNEAFLGSSGNVRDLLVALSQTEVFRYRPSSTSEEAQP